MKLKVIRRLGGKKEITPLKANALFRHCAGGDTCTEETWPEVKALLFCHGVLSIVLSDLEGVADALEQGS